MDELDKLRCAGAQQMPPALAAQGPSRPWKTPMKQMVWGLALIHLTLQFLGLDIILPAVGTVLLWLGLRPLRRENGGFRFAYGCATVYAGLRMVAMVLQSTPFALTVSELMGMEWRSSAGAVPFFYVLCAVILQGMLTLAAAGLWRGLKAVFVDAGQPPHTAAVAGLVILEALMIPLSLIGLDGWLLVGPILLLLVLLLWRLHQLGKSLDEAGYALTPAPRLSSGSALSVWLGVPLLAMIILSLLFARLPILEQTPVSGPDGASTLGPELLNLGFPKDILSALPAGQLAKFQGAYGLTVTRQDDFVGDHPDGIPSTVMLEVPVQDDHYGFRTVYLAYLRWSAEEVPDGGYMEGIRVTPDWHGVTVRTACPDGALQWRDSAGALHLAPLSFFFRADSSGTAFYYADFSLPKGAEEPVEGWVSWEAVPAFPETVTSYNYQLAFAHRLIPWQYPYRLPSDVLLSGQSPLGWRLSYQRTYIGQLAPDGQYTSGRS